MSEPRSDGASGLATITEFMKRPENRFRRPVPGSEETSFQDEKDFTQQIPLNKQNNRCYTKVKKSEIPPDSLYHPGNKQSLKLMMSCCASWNGITKPFFLDPSKVRLLGNTIRDI